MSSRCTNCGSLFVPSKPIQRVCHRCVVLGLYEFVEFIKRRHHERDEQVNRRKNPRQAKGKGKARH